MASITDEIWLWKNMLCTAKLHVFVFIRSTMHRVTRWSTVPLDLCMEVERKNRRLWNLRQVSFIPCYIPCKMCKVINLNRAWICSNTSIAFRKHFWEPPFNFRYRRLSETRMPYAQSMFMHGCKKNLHPWFMERDRHVWTNSKPHKRQG